MFEIKITLDATPALVALLQGLVPAQTTAAAPANPKPVAESPVPAAPVPAPMPAQTGPVIPFPAQTAAPALSAPVPAAPAVPTAPTTTPGYTADQVGRAGSELISAHPEKMKDLWALLASYGVQAITDLKPEQLGPVATALRGMGAKL